MNNFYISTAIDYANGHPHLGHAYEKILADVIRRYKVLRGDKVYFITGLDEHGQKVQQSAIVKKIRPLIACNRISNEFKNMCCALNIFYNDYIRTTEERHRSIVQSILCELYRKNKIYIKNYQGFYSTKAEQFLQKKDKIHDKWPNEFGDVKIINEKNYFFKLSRYRNWLVECIKNQSFVIHPRFYENQVLKFLENPLKDLCISRPKERLGWGIELTFNKRFVAYVWIDALINYISAIKYGNKLFYNYWPLDCQIIGKDILIPSHAIYFPILLKAFNLSLPRVLLVHGWWKINKNKMSKSIGNVVNPIPIISIFNPDSVRFHLVREMSIGRDSDFSAKRFIDVYNGELANKLGNLFNRILSMCKLFCDDKVPSYSVIDYIEVRLHRHWDRISNSTIESFDNYQFNFGIVNLFKHNQFINRYIDSKAPWVLSKLDLIKNLNKIESIVAVSMESLRSILIFLKPIVPSACNSIIRSIGISSSGLSFKDSLRFCHLPIGVEVGQSVILFPKKT